MAAIFLLRMQNEILRREIHRPWVVALVNGQIDKTAGQK
jgi:hypothetical protein